MWWCNTCKEYFDEPEIQWEHHSELNGMGGIIDEEYCVCPVCHDYDIDECKDKCDSCKQTVHETKYVGNFELCFDCWEKLRDIMSETADKIVGELDVDRYDAEELISNFFE